MKKKFFTCFSVLLLVFGIAGLANALILDFSGGTVTEFDSSTWTTTAADPFTYDAVSYVEDGFQVEFVGSTGIIGDYYNGYTGKTLTNNVIHAHWGTLTSIVFSRVDGAAFDLNYMDLTSNTTVGGFQATGTELSYVTASNSTSMLLPSSDWGIGFLSDGVTAGDGIVRLWMTAGFDNITSFTVSSQNAYCFGLDNFYIDEEAPPTVPEPATMFLLGSGLIGLAGVSRKFRK